MAELQIEQQARRNVFLLIIILFFALVVVPMLIFGMGGLFENKTNVLYFSFFEGLTIFSLLVYLIHNLLIKRKYLTLFTPTLHEPEKGILSSAIPKWLGNWNAWSLFKLSFIVSSIVGLIAVFYHFSVGDIPIFSGIKSPFSESLVVGLMPVAETLLIGVLLGVWYSLSKRWAKNNKVLFYLYYFSGVLLMMVFGFLIHLTAYQNAEKDLFGAALLYARLSFWVVITGSIIPSLTDHFITNFLRRASELFANEAVLLSYISFFVVAIFFMILISIRKSNKRRSENASDNK